MGLPKTEERRRKERQKLETLLPGKMHNQKDNEVIEYKVLNISAGGLGIEAKKYVEAGSHLLLRGDNVEIKFIVVWSQEDSEPGQGFYCGLQVEKPTDNIIEIFKRAGWLKTQD